jgi:hypothetical protein
MGYDVKTVFLILKAIYIQTLDYINAIILPRQAREKHGKNSKTDRFLAG